MLASVTSLIVGDDADAWQAAGFAVVDGRCTVGDVDLIFGGPGPGITAWTVFHPDLPTGERFLDGLATEVIAELPEVRREVHPNGTTGLDHVVVSSPDIERTTSAFGSIGVEPRRTRDTTAGDAPLRQRFFRVGTIVELIGPPQARPDGGPARFWGLALVADDLESTARSLGAHLGRVKDAVQPGRRIATLRTDELGISVPVAFMTPHRSP